MRLYLLFLFYLFKISNIQPGCYNTNGHTSTLTFKKHLIIWKKKNIKY